MSMVKATPIYTGAGAVYPYSEYLEKKFTLKTNFDDPFDLYKRQGKMIMLPREFCPLGKEDRRIHGIPIHTTSTFKPRNDEQERVVRESVARLENGQSHILSAPTGFGKTIIGAEIIHRLGLKSLIVITKEDIRKQWRDALMMVMGLKAEQIGYIQGDRYDVAGKQVCIGMVHSLWKEGRYPSWVYNEFGLIMPDEVHRMAADKFSQSMWLLPGKLRIGLSATPRRRDGRDIVFLGHIGQVRVSTEMEVLPAKVLILTLGYRVLRKITSMPGKTTHIDKILVKNVERNKKIAEFVKKAYDKGRSVVVFSSLTEHLNVLQDFIVMGGVPMKDTGFYVGGLKDKERDVAASKPVVLATYQMTAEATNYPWWDTAVMATPRADVQQIIGRILREYPDKKPPVVLDIVDKDSDTYVKYFRSRMRFYESRCRNKGWQVVRMN